MLLHETELEDFDRNDLIAEKTAPPALKITCGGYTGRPKCSTVQVAGVFRAGSS